MKIFQILNIRFLSISFLFFLLTQIAVAMDRESYILIDSVALGDTVMVKLHSLTNASGSTTRMEIDVYPGDSPIEIKKIEWERRDTVWTTLKPVAITLNNRALNGQRIYWNITFDFDYTEFFGYTDRLMVYTDKGVFANFTSENGKLNDDIRKLTDERNELLAENDISQKESARYRNLWIIFLITSSLLLITLIVFVIFSRRIKNRLNDNLCETGARLEAISQRNRYLEEQNGELYRNRLDSINKLCEDYYDKNNSENTRAVLYNDLKNYILSFKSKKKIEQIQAEVDSLQDNLMTRIKEQLPDLNSDEIALITYIVGGFSAKTISVFTDINTKQFYYRRQKLLQQILASDAPDKEFFASKI